MLQQRLPSFRKWCAPFTEFCKWCAPIAEFRKSCSIVADKNAFFGVFLPVFCPVSCFFTDNLYMTRIFFEKIGPSLFFLAAGVTETKVRRSTGVTTANSTNKDPKANKLSWAINYRLPKVALLGSKNAVFGLKPFFVDIRAKESAQKSCLFGVRSWW